MLRKTEMLLIRACKSRDPQKRLVSVYRRFYYNGNMTEIQVNNALICILGGLPESCIPKVSPAKVYEKLIEEMNYGAMWKENNKHLSYYMLTYMVDLIRYRQRDHFPDDMIW